MSLQLRRRARYLALALGTIAVGLLVHRSGRALPPAVRDFAGDALWAVMMAWWIGVLAPGVPLLRRSGVALAVCFAVEASQLYHAPWLDALRSTTGGRLVLGSGFDPRDLAAYTVGVLVATFLERWAVRRRVAGPRRVSRRGATRAPSS